jgi:hypothetical protein
MLSFLLHKPGGVGAVGKHLGTPREAWGEAGTAVGKVEKERNGMFGASLTYTMRSFSMPAQRALCCVS